MADTNLYQAPGPIRRLVCFTLGAPLTAGGAWFLLSHVLYGEVTLRRALLAGVALLLTGGVLLVTALFPKVNL